MTQKECEKVIRFATAVSRQRKDVSPESLCRLMILANKVHRVNEHDIHYGLNESGRAKRAKLLASAAEIAHAIDARLDMTPAGYGLPLTLVYSGGDGGLIRIGIPLI